MSREERRQYERMMRNTERGPALPPAAKARAERNAARRARRPRPAEESGGLTRQYVVRALVIAAVLGLISFSLQWPEMPWALYVGLAVSGAALAVMIAFRLLGSRRPAPPAG
jgi:hypothetical protein